MGEEWHEGIRDISEEQHTQRIIDRYFRAGIKTSWSLPSADFTKGDYEALPLKQYVTVPENSDKIDLFAAQSHPDIGWKFHLNVAPEQIAKVSDYLKEREYAHKFLFGGEIADGKIFTLYLGSWRNARMRADEISKDLAEHLLQPKAPDEVELAPGVVGRFSVSGKTPSGKDFHHYGWGYGFSLLNDYVEQLAMLDIQIGLAKTFDEKSTLEVERDQLLKKTNVESYQALRQEYGDYFFKEPSAS